MYLADSTRVTLPIGLSACAFSMDSELRWASSSHHSAAQSATDAALRKRYHISLSAARADRNRSQSPYCTLLCSVLHGHQPYSGLPFVPRALPRADAVLIVMLDDLSPRSKHSPLQC